ncbi:hypothetical protein CPB84DRAFT_1660272, partial [Gymnopilus junonius]
SHLHHLFASIVLFSTPEHPDQLWHEFKHAICDDLMHTLYHLGHLHISQEEIYDYGL